MRGPGPERHGGIVSPALPIHHAIWKVGASPEPLSLSKLASEKELQDMVTARPEVLSAAWMRIGRARGPVAFTAPSAP